MQFRFHLLDSDGKICAAESICADDDKEALAIAALLWAACSDVCSDYGLWQDSRQVSGRFSEQVHGSTAETAIRRHHEILDLEERLLTGFATLQGSAKLARHVTEHRAQVPKRAPAEP